MREEWADTQVSAKLGARETLFIVHILLEHSVSLEIFSVVSLVLRIRSDKGLMHAGQMLYY